MEITITLSQVLAIAAAISAIAAAYKIVSKPVKTLNEKFDKYDKLLDNDKKHLEKLDAMMIDIKNDLNVQGDMTYQILSHMATNNNTGGMASALDKYNEFFRHRKP